ncbi:flagellar motor switch protein FliG [Roseitranquillus sediminis]|uniref:flagellar motor switch protein FliG n=1 Tax=Roseitranquillus sediminis TaxID=2809051 RepID=UPI001D0C8353|nr:FliG C-terminal domain-containing protein [Roseitranquillus sediminis]MBM9595236.1 flagellar motor switch protein FliG [Roseitranquillus sediminis]
MALALDTDFSSDLSTSLPNLGGKAAHLSKRQKAAIVVRVLLAEGAQISLSDLPDQLQIELARQMSQMRFVDRATLSAVVDEFLAEIDDIGLTFQDGIEGALSALDGAISANTASRLRQQAGLITSDDVWERISGIGNDRLLPVLESESAEIASIILSKLKVSKAAELLSQLPGERARRIAYAMSLTADTEAKLVDKIGSALAAALNVDRDPAFRDGPVQRLGAILNYSRSVTRDDVLDGLDEKDVEFANEVRKAIFTFAFIPSRIDARDIPKITREVDVGTLAAAVAGATGKDKVAAEFILENMSKRLAETVREDAAALGNVKKKDTEAALNAVVTAIRKLEAAGTIYQISGEDEDE